MIKKKLGTIEIHSFVYLKPRIKRKKIDYFIKFHE